MRVFAISDLHIDYTENRRWVDNISREDYKDDILILAGDISDLTEKLSKTFSTLSRRFHSLFYVPGNHDLWIKRNKRENSLESFEIIREIARDHGAIMEPGHFDKISIVPLFGWYDYSFGMPKDELLPIWADYRACTWPEGLDEKSVTNYFITLNEPVLNTTNTTVISFSHFLPRIDIMPSFIPMQKRIIYPVLGTIQLEEQIRKLGSQIHVYGHSHLNRSVKKKKVLYVNNALGYPREVMLSSRKLLCIFDEQSSGDEE